jgi:hypothetical protein
MRSRIVLLGVLLALPGCGSGPKFVPVSGTVTLNGKPLPRAAVYFNPIPPAGKMDAGAVGSLAITDADGRYTLVMSGTGGTPGAVVADHRVRITTRGVVDESAPLGKPTAELVPDKYSGMNSELTFTVPPGGTDAANFDLK